MKKEQNEITLWQIIKGYFNALPDRSDEKDTIAQISSGVAFHGSNLWILVFAIFIASLGLNVNSTAVIIGAMLISPLMGPITGMGLAVGINDIGLLKRSIKSYLIATVISVLTAAIYFLISPLTEARSELLSRTSPSLYDVLIALCGGAAGILALATKGKGNVIPGVAIATALCRRFVLQVTGWLWVMPRFSSARFIFSSSIPSLSLCLPLLEFECFALDASK